MTSRTYNQIPNAETGHRPLLAKAEPRNKTVCFNLSETEKMNLDKLCMALNSTRSRLISELVVGFIDTALGDGDENVIAELLSKATANYSDQKENIEKMIK